MSGGPGSPGSRQTVRPKILSPPGPLCPLLLLLCLLLFLYLLTFFSWSSSSFLPQAPSDISSSHLWRRVPFVSPLNDRHHGLNGHEFEQTPGDSGGQGSLACCIPGVAKSKTCLKRLSTHPRTTGSIGRCGNKEPMGSFHLLHQGVTKLRRRTQAESPRRRS